MLKRRKERELAMQILFAWDVHGEADLQVMNGILDQGTSDDAIGRAAADMANAVWEQREAIDQMPASGEPFRTEMEGRLREYERAATGELDSG